MKILRQYTRMSLKANRTRTLVTIIGIILSMTLFTAVLEGAYSGQQFLIRSIEESEGRWLLCESGLSEAEAAGLRETDGVGESSVWREVGLGKIRSKNRSNPLRVASVDENVGKLLAIHLISGRMPANADELLLPSHLAIDGGLRIRQGETLTLELVQRVDATSERITSEAGYDPAEPETIEGAKEHTYTVVGIYRRFIYDMEDNGATGYLALTGGGEKASAPASESKPGDCTVFFTLKNPAGFFSWCDAHPAIGNRAVHTELRRFHGLFTDDNYNAYLYGFAAVLLLLVVFGSISLIYNSFSISVSARTQQFGILKSIGATSRQIRGSVLYEALVLAAIAIPIGLVVGCIGIGLTLYFLRDAFAVGLFMAERTQMELVLNPLILIAAAGICLLTTVVSAAVPARRAIRVSPILSIRQTEEIRVRKKRTGSGRLAQKLFGFPGLLAVRNFQRSRSKYRSTVASLVLSLVLFISASGFCSYLTGSVETVANTGTKETRVDISYQISGSERLEPEEVLSFLADAGNTENATYYEADGREFSFPGEILTKDALEMLQMLADRSERYWGSLIFLQDSAFQKLCEVNGFTAEDYFDAAKPKALVWNRVFLRMETEGGVKSGSFPLLKEHQASSLSAPELKLMDGYVPGGLESYEDGRELACYYPVGEDGEALWDQEPLRLPLTEAQIDRAYAIGGYLREPVFGLPTVSFALVYPFHLKEAVLGSAYDLNETEYAFQAANHARSYSAMEKELAAAGMDTSRLNDMAASDESSRLLVMAINVFAYGFILLISLITVTNVFNTISTNVLLRRREFVMLRSVGLSSRGFRQMMNYECLIYGLKALLLGLPAAVLVTFAVWRLVLRVTWSGFYIPWQSLVTAIFSVFAVVFLTMLYAMAKVRKLNVVDALKDENL